MTNPLLLACLLSLCAVSSFAQSPVNVAGAKLVAERDAAYARAHPGMNTTPAAPHHAKKRHTKHHRQVAHKAVK